MKKGKESVENEAPSASSVEVIALMNVRINGKSHKAGDTIVCSHFEAEKLVEYEAASYKVVRD